MSQSASDAPDGVNADSFAAEQVTRAQTNGEDDEIEGPPTKKRHLDESVPQRRKPDSPPWKKVIAEGPSSFTQDGIRKSGRTNQVPLALQPKTDQRQTRGAKQNANAQNAKHSTSNGQASYLSSRDLSMVSSSAGPRRISSVPLAALQSPRSASNPTTNLKRSQRRSALVESKTDSLNAPDVICSRRDIQASPGVRASRSYDVAHEGALNHVFSSRTTLTDSPKSKLSRIRLKVKPQALPLTHPGLVASRPKLFSDLKELLECGSHIPLEHGGLFYPDDGLPYTPESITRDARVILRLEGAAEPGGSLAPGACSVYQPQEQEQEIEQYAHADHLSRAAIGFRRLMLIEQRKHQSTAKRLAELCRDEWYRRQPKTSEQMEAEELDIVERYYKVVMRSLQGTWENVRAEVNRRRLAEWEVREQARVRKALNEAVDESTQKLQARRIYHKPGMANEEYEEENSEDCTTDDSLSEVDDEDSNVSSSSSENGLVLSKQNILDDENLTVEQLREKYAMLQSQVEQPITRDGTRGDTPTVSPRALRQSSISDDSDESVEMDDDLGSSDDADGEDQDSGNDLDHGSQDGEEGASNLLGFLAPSETNLFTDTSTALPFDDSNSDEGAESVESVGPADPDVVVHRVVVPSAHASADSPVSQPVLKAIMTSPDRSSQPTPRTAETKLSEIDSASSVDPHHSSCQATRSATPQPPSHPQTPIPPLLRGTLREYQHYGLDWLAGLYANNTNGILADEMGLGKTIQTIALLAHLACEHEVWGPHLVIVPTSVMLNWEMEFKKWCPGFKILTYYGTQEERKRKRLGWKSDDVWNVCVTSYQLVLQDQQVFKRRKWHYMILDEAHNIKNFQSQRWQTMLTFNTRARLLLTGTPLQNNLTELWSLLYFLMPTDGKEKGVGGFANLREFQDWFKRPSEQILEHGREKLDQESRAIIGKLHKVLRPYLLRRLKVDVEKQMPAKYEHVEFCRLSKRQRELYDSFLNREDIRGTLASGNFLSIINCLMQLRKVCNHPDLFLDRPILTSFPMQRSVVADYEINDLLVRRLLREDPMTKASLDFLNLVPTTHEIPFLTSSDRSGGYTAQRMIIGLREAQRVRAQQALTHLDPSTVRSNLTYLESASRWARFEELQHCVYLNALRRQQKPIYGSRLVQRLTIGIDNSRRCRPQKRSQLLSWLENTSPSLATMLPSISSVSQLLQSTIQKFACVTPAVIARDMNSFLIPPKALDTCLLLTHRSGIDPFHEARMRLSVQFPDKRLLQYDCGKLQTLDKLLRKLQAGGHRALIFTQMTKVLDILEQFLNIHGHKYLRLDGATKIEQRQILTDRFNNDPRILAFILSSRSGGLGINLTGADTVIFYDLDWNPAMDKQCQDRCHRIGQTRDVHIYRLVSEHTIEANILRKANQKRMLDDVVIQEGDFTTDYLNRIPVHDVLAGNAALLDGDAAANAAMDRVLGGPQDISGVRRVLSQAEDREDVAAAKAAEQELMQTDAADFDENGGNMASAISAVSETPQCATPTTGIVPLEQTDPSQEPEELSPWGKAISSIDNYMLSIITGELEDGPVELPKSKNKNRRRVDHRHPLHRAL